MSEIQSGYHGRLGHVETAWGAPPARAAYQDGGYSAAVGVAVADAAHGPALVAVFYC